MRRTSFGEMPCPIARSLEQVGEWWRILILRDALAGLTRFEEFQDSLGIAPNMLTRRLQALVEAGLLERHPYSERPPRHEYRLTARGRDFRPVLLAMLAWGDRHFAPEGTSVEIVDARTGAPAEPVLVDRASGRPIDTPDFTLAAGEGVRRRLARRRPPAASTVAGGMDPRTRMLLQGRPLPTLLRLAWPNTWSCSPRPRSG